MSQLPNPLTPATKSQAVAQIKNICNDDEALLALANDNFAPWSSILVPSLHEINVETSRNTSVALRDVEFYRMAALTEQYGAHCQVVRVVGRDVMPISTYFLSIAPPATGKSRAMKDCRRGYQEGCYANLPTVPSPAQPPGQDAEQAPKDAGRNGKDGEDARYSGKIAATGSITGQSLRDRCHKESPVLPIVSAEGGALFSGNAMSERSAAELFPALNDVWDGTTTTISTVTGGTQTLRDVNIALNIAVQDSVFVSSNFRAIADGTGFSSRTMMNLLTPEQIDPSRFVLNPLLHHAVVGALPNTYDASPYTSQMQADSEAMKAHLAVARRLAIDARKNIVGRQAGTGIGPRPYFEFEGDAALLITHFHNAFRRGASANEAMTPYFQHLSRGSEQISRMAAAIHAFTLGEDFFRLYDDAMQLLVASPEKKVALASPVPAECVCLAAIYYARSVRSWFQLASVSVDDVTFQQLRRDTLRVLKDRAQRITGNPFGLIRLTDFSTYLPNPLRGKAEKAALRDDVFRALEDEGAIATISGRPRMFSAIDQSAGSPQIITATTYAGAIQ